MSDTLDKIEAASRSALRLMVIGFGTFIAVVVAGGAIASITGAVFGPIEVLLMLVVAMLVPVVVVRRARGRGLRLVVGVLAALGALLLFASVRKPTYTSSVSCRHDGVQGTPVVVATGPGNGQRFECR